MKAEEWSGFTQEFRQRMLNVYAKFDHSSIQHAHYFTQGTKALKQRARQRKYVDNLAEVRKQEFLSEELWSDNHALSQLQARIEGATYVYEESCVKFMKNAINMVEDREKSRCKEAKRRAHKKFARRTKINFCVTTVGLLLFILGILIFSQMKLRTESVSENFRRALVLAKEPTPGFSSCEISAGPLPSFKAAERGHNETLCFRNTSTDELHVYFYHIANANLLENTESEEELKPTTDRIGPFVFRVHTRWENVRKEDSASFVSYSKSVSYEYVSGAVSDLHGTRLVTLNQGHLSFVKRLKNQFLDEDVLLPLYASSRLYKEASNISSVAIGAQELFAEANCNHGVLTFGCFVDTWKLATQHSVHGIYGFEAINNLYLDNLFQLPVFGEQPLSAEQADSLFEYLIPKDQEGEEDLLSASESEVLPNRAAHNALHVLEVFETLWSRNSADTIFFTSTLSRLDRAKSDGDYALFYTVLSLEENFCRAKSAKIVPGGLICSQVNDLAQYLLFMQNHMKDEMDTLKLQQGTFASLSIFQLLFRGYSDAVTHLFYMKQRAFWEMVADLESRDIGYYNTSHITALPAIYPIENSRFEAETYRPTPYTSQFYKQHSMMEHGSQEEDVSRISSLFAIDGQTHVSSFGVNSIVRGFQPHRLGPLLDIRYSGKVRNVLGEVMSRDGATQEWPNLVSVWKTSVGRPLSYESAGHFTLEVASRAGEEWDALVDIGKTEVLPLDDARSALNGIATSADSQALLLTKFVSTSSVLRQPVGASGVSSTGLSRYPSDEAATDRCLVSLQGLLPYGASLLLGLGTASESIRDGNLKCRGDGAGSSENVELVPWTNSEIVVEPVSGVVMQYTAEETHLIEVFPTVSLQVAEKMLLPVMSRFQHYSTSREYAFEAATVLSNLRENEWSTERTAKASGGILFTFSILCFYFVWKSPRYEEAAVTPIDKLETEVTTEYNRLIEPVQKNLNDAIADHQEQKSKVEVRKVGIEAGMEPSQEVEEGVVVLGISRKGSIYKVGDVDTNIADGAQIRREIEERYDDQDDYGLNLEPEWNSSSMDLEQQTFPPP